jgi:stage V sporulation protein D (sporulation-specific penicillin-binding protein)
VLALDQWMRDVPLQAERGEIFDRNGVVLADSRTVYNIYARPVSITNKEATAEALSRVLGLNYNETFNKINTRRSEVTIARGVSKDIMYALLQTAATGIYFSQNIQRVYPFGDFMTQVIGFTNLDSNGQTGVEMQYNDFLRGTNGYILTETDLVGRQLNRNVTRYVAGTKGNNVFLTLDYHIQSFAEAAITNAMNNHGAKSASIIVMDVNTGAIAAMAQNPSFNLNEIPRDDIAKLFSQSKSTLITDVFEPGSTFKILTAAIGLERGVVSREKTRTFCGGAHIVDGQRIKCWRTIGHGSLSFDEGVMNSCNVLFMNTALAIGAPVFYDYIEKLGLKRKSGIDIAGEGAGLAIPLNQVKNVDLARIGFGHAIATTPIGLMVATAAVINGGNVVTPHVLGRVENQRGQTIHRPHTPVTGGVISAQTSAQMREVLELTVSNGSGRHAGVAGHRIGGKTGTAQKYVQGGGVAGGKYVSTFIGFAPAENPRYLALIVVDEPVGAYYGSLVAAPYIGQLFANIFQYEQIEPTLPLPTLPEFQMPNLIGLGVNEAVMQLRLSGMHIEVSGTGGVVRGQIPAAGASVTKNNVALIQISG